MRLPFPQHQEQVLPGVGMKEVQRAAHLGTSRQFQSLPQETSNELLDPKAEVLIGMQCQMLKPQLHGIITESPPAEGRLTGIRL